jgi:hypothetical protein
MLKLIGIMSLLMIVSIGCDDTANPGNVKNVAEQNTTTVNGLVDYGHGVWYFPYTGAEFGNALSSFIGDRGKQPIAMSPNDTGEYGKTIGYFVVIR